MLEDLHEHLLTRDRELDSRECTIAASKDGLAIYDRALGRVCMERDVERTRTEAI
jgi:hypothetical protein